jgi:chromosome segregation ATPase
MKIAEALVLRKHLEAKVKQLEPLKVQGENGLFELKIQRQQVNENVDEVKMQVPKVTLADVTAEYDKYSKTLRQLDTAIQEANWTNELTVELDKTIAV